MSVVHLLPSSHVTAVFLHPPPAVQVSVVQRLPSLHVFVGLEQRPLVQTSSVQTLPSSQLLGA